MVRAAMDFATEAAAPHSGPVAQFTDGGVKATTNVANAFFAMTGVAAPVRRLRSAEGCPSLMMGNVPRTLQSPVLASALELLDPTRANSLENPSLSVLRRSALDVRAGSSRDPDSGANNTGMGSGQFADANLLCAADVRAKT